MDLSIRKRTTCNVKYCYAIRLKFGDKILTSLPKLCSKRKPVSALPLPDKFTSTPNWARKKNRCGKPQYTTGQEITGSISFSSLLPR